MNLLDLARKFDGSEDIDERIALAEQMKPLLGERLAEFERRYDFHVNDRHRLPGLAALAEMDLIGVTPPRAAHVVSLLNSADDALPCEPTDWESALREIRESLMDWLRPAEAV